MSGNSEPPLEPDSDERVIYIGDLLVQRGRAARRESGQCKHKRLIYSIVERRVWCDECGQTIDGFVAFMSLVDQYEMGWRKLDQRQERIREAESHALFSRAAKAVDKIWRSRHLVPMCRCCGRGLLPEDFAGGAGGVSAEIERQRRKNEGEGKP